MKTGYEDVKKNEKLLTALTSLTIAEFGEILAVFGRLRDERVSRSDRRERAYGGGRKPVLAKAEDRLLFILYY